MVDNLPTDRRRMLWLWLVLFTVLSFLSTGRWAFPLAAWLVGIFGLRFYRHHPRAVWGYVLLAFGAYVGGTAAWWGATLNYENPEIDLIVGMFSVPLGMLPFAIDRWALGHFRRCGPAATWHTLVFPLAVAGLTFLSVGLAPWGSFGATAYSQYGWLPVMQLSAVTGLWGYEFLIAWFASVVNYAWEDGFRWRDSARAVTVYGTVLALVVGFGVGRLWLSSSGQTEVRVVGLTVDPDLDQLGIDQDDPEFAAAAAAQHEEFLVRTAAAAERGAEIVIWPEVAGAGDPQQVGALIEAAGTLAADHGIYLVMHTVTIPEDGDLDPKNELRIVAPDGRVVLTHEKYAGNLEKLYGGSGSRAINTIETPHGTLSGIVCWDADFPDTVSQVGRLDADLLFVSAKDWYEVRDVHARMSVFRAVENGVSMFRQTATGVSLASDAYGRVLSYVDSHDGIFEQDVEVPLNATGTLYPEVRDAFGWAALLGLVVLLMGTGLRARRVRRATRELVGTPSLSKAPTPTRV